MSAKRRSLEEYEVVGIVCVTIFLAAVGVILMEEYSHTKATQSYNACILAASPDARELCKGNR